MIQRNLLQLDIGFVLTDVDHLLMNLTHAVRQRGLRTLKGLLGIGWVKFNQNITFF
ncbi:hypothetical protein OS31_32720 [Dickeya oryzae]